MHISIIITIILFVRGRTRSGGSTGGARGARATPDETLAPPAAPPFRLATKYALRIHADYYTRPSLQTYSSGMCQVVNDLKQTARLRD